MAQWWDSNRLLAKGSRGEDVKRLQEKLNKTTFVDKVNPTGLFDAATEASLKEFQKLNGLIDDGQAGPITQSVLFGGNYTFSIMQPPVVIQDLDLCWAASTEAVLKSSWTGWPKLKALELKEKYKTFIDVGTGFISAAGIEKVVVDHGGSVKVGINGSFVRIEKISAFLFRHRRQILLGDHLLGAGHVRVIYGVTVRNGVPALMVMDPLSGYSTQDLQDLQDAKGDVFVAAPFDNVIVGEL